MWRKHLAKGSLGRSCGSISSERPWIFGYGLDYRYMSILQREFHASSTDADGSGSVIVFLMADKRFTVFVEISPKQNTIPCGP